MTTHLFLTRHGKSLHNDHSNERIWSYNNDDIFGLTMQGVDQVAEKARILASEWLVKDITTRLCDSGAIRAKQTSSLIRQILKAEGCDVIKEVFSCLNRASVMREFPSDFEEKGWSTDFKFSEFAANPRYNANGWCESFVQRVDICRQYLKSSDLLVYFRNMYPTVSTNNGTSQTILVGHHYALCALLAAILIQREASVSKSRLNWEWNALYEQIIQKVHQWHFNHHHVLYVTPLLTGRCEEQFLPQWFLTKTVLEKEAGLDLKGLVSCA